LRREREKVKERQLKGEIRNAKEARGSGVRTMMRIIIEHKLSTDSGDSRQVTG
jgi:hypothetical protein